MLRVLGGLLTGVVWVSIGLIYVLIGMVRSVMTTLEAIQAAQARQGLAIANIAADVRELIGKIGAPGGLTEEQAQAVAAQAGTIADNLETIAADYTSSSETPSPAPEPPPL